MTRYWAIAPYHAEMVDTFERAWSYDQANNCIAIGWPAVGNANKLTLSEIERAIEHAYGPGHSGGVRQIWTFFHQVSPGDIVLARRGLTECLDVGTVTSNAYCDFSRGITRIGGNLQREVKPNFINVEWQHRSPVSVAPRRFSRFTISEIDPIKYRDVIAPTIERKAS